MNPSMPMLGRALVTLAALVTALAGVAAPADATITHRSTGGGSTTGAAAWKIKCSTQYGYGTTHRTCLGALVKPLAGTADCLVTEVMAPSIRNYQDSGTNRVADYMTYHVGNPAVYYDGFTLMKGSSDSGSGVWHLSGGHASKSNPSPDGTSGTVKKVRDITNQRVHSVHLIGVQVRTDQTGGLPDKTFSSLELQVGCP